LLAVTHPTHREGQRARRGAGLKGRRELVAGIAGETVKVAVRRRREHNEGSSVSPRQAGSRASGFASAGPGCCVERDGDRSLLRAQACGRLIESPGWAAAARRRPARRRWCRNDERAGAGARGRGRELHIEVGGVAGWTVWPPGAGRSRRSRWPNGDGWRRQDHGCRVHHGEMARDRETALDGAEIHGPAPAAGARTRVHS